jgi:hypothetical protein
MRRSLATLDEWAPPWIVGITRREHFARLDLDNALRSRLTYAQGTILEREAPTHFTVPSGSNIPIDYLDGDIPTLSVRLQEMFGLSQTPSVAAGRATALVETLVAGAASGANHPRSRELLGARVPRSEEGPEGPLPQTLLAGRSLHRRTHAPRAPAPAAAMMQMHLVDRFKYDMDRRVKTNTPRFDERLQWPFSRSC